MKYRHLSLFAVPPSLIVVAMTYGVSRPPAPAVSRACDCRPEVSLSGSYVREREPKESDMDQIRASQESINGTSFQVTVSGLPQGTYTVEIRATDPTSKGKGERIFDVTVDGRVIASDFDIFASAGGGGHVAKIIGTVEHTDDALRGPLKISFRAKKGEAKFNEIEIRNSQGETVAKFTAQDLADPFVAAASRIPNITSAPIWRNASHSLADRENDLVRRMSLAEKVAQLKNDAPAIERLGLPAFNYWNEALHGVANNGFATVFPEPVGAASSFNPSLFREEGRIIGIEGRAKFNDYANQNHGDSKWWTGLTYWTPNVNIFRDPRWGRGQETYGEDPFLAGEIGVQFVKGIQGDDPKHMLAMACAKHYAVHSGPEADRHRFDAVPSETDLYDTYLPQFERVVREGKVGGVMSSYNAVYGVPASASSLLLTDILRKKWKFDGYVVSDCGAIGDIWQQHRYVKTPEEAAAAAVKAGCNLCCGGDYNALVKAVQKGLLTEKDLDEALRRTLWTRFKLGLFDPPASLPYSKISLSDNDTPEHGKVALEIARQSLVLLKNDGILPLDRSKLKKIAVIGPNADSRSMLEGNYHGSTSHPVSILAGIKRLAGAGVEVDYAMGCPITSDKRIAAWSRQDNETTRSLDDLSSEAVKLASESDLVIYVGGITPAQEGEGFDRHSIELPVEQRNLVQALHSTGKPVVMVNCSGSAVALPWEADHLSAILQAWYPGQEGGTAVAEVLFGDVNPSGHLPVTFYRSTEDLPSFTDYSMANRTYRYFKGKPLYAFGHGLSYSKFEYSDAKLAENVVSSRGALRLKLTVKNTSGPNGAEVAQVYYRKSSEAKGSPSLSLCGFQRIEIARGATKVVEIRVPLRFLRRWDSATKKYVVTPGSYELLAGSSSDHIRVKLPFTVQ